MKQIYNFILPHLSQQNINEAMNILFKLADDIGKLKTQNEVLMVKNTQLLEENKYIKSHLHNLLNEMKSDIHHLDNSNLINLLHLTKYQLEEQKMVGNEKQLSST